jgi:TRAP-type C4-dicarboxylate transport system permease small subunit
MRIEKIKRLSARIGQITKGIAWISFVCVVAMMLMNVVDVIMGYVANKHILGAYELTQRLLMCAVFTSFAYGQSKKTHINMTIVIAKFPRALRFVLFTVMSILSVLAAGAMTYAAWAQTAVCIEKNYLTEVLYIPLWPFYLIETIAMAIFTVALIYDTVLYVISIFRDDFAEMVQADWS